jgi:hypothetical protein
MAELFERIQLVARENRYFFSDHADNMLRERGILHWQIVEGLQHGKLLAERPNTRPNPTVEVEQLLPDGVPYMAVWGHVRALDTAKLVTVHFFDR